MKLWPGWKSLRALGWWEVHHLEHDECGWQTHRVFDFIKSEDCADARRLMAGHEKICPEPGYTDV